MPLPLLIIGALTAARVAAPRAIPLITKGLKARPWRAPSPTVATATRGVTSRAATSRTYQGPKPVTNKERATGAVKTTATVGTTGYLGYSGYQIAKSAIKPAIIGGGIATGAGLGYTTGKAVVRGADKAAKAITSPTGMIVIGVAGIAGLALYMKKKKG